MKILFWMFTGFDRHITSEHLLLADIEQLCRAGHTVHVLQKHTGGSLPSIPKSLSSFPVTTDAIPFQAAAKGNFIARYLSELKYVRRCKKYIPSDCDAVFVQSNNVAGFAIKAIKRKLPHAIVTFNVQDIFPYNLVSCGKIKEKSAVFKVLAAVQRYGYKRCDRIITISEDMKDTLIADGTEKNKIETVYNWSYQDDLYDVPASSDLFCKDYFNVVYAGNIGVMQNVDLLIEAANCMKDDADVWFHIIGDGVYKQKLEAKAAEYGLERISFHPMQPPESAPAIYASADVNVIPLVKDGYKTALPSKTATCMACRRPVIFAIGSSSKFGQKMARECGCLLTEADRPDLLADAVRAVRRGEVGGNTGDFFLKHCNKTQNSKRVAEIITRRG